MESRAPPGQCRSANAFPLFTAQLHPAGTSQAQPEAAGKLEERSEGEGTHQLPQQRKECFSSPAFTPRREFFGAETLGSFCSRALRLQQFCCCSAPGLSCSPHAAWAGSTSPARALEHAGGSGITPPGPGCWWEAGFGAPQKLGLLLGSSGTSTGRRLHALCLGALFAQNLLFPE